MNETLCWKCDKKYDWKDNKCPHCGATNANADWDKAAKEMLVAREQNAN